MTERRSDAADLGKTGSALFLFGRSGPLIAPFPGNRCTALYVLIVGINRKFLGLVVDGQLEPVRQERLHHRRKLGRGSTGLGFRLTAARLCIP